MVFKSTSTSARGRPRRLALAVAFGLPLGVASLQAADTQGGDPVTSRGLQHAAEGRPLLEAAMASTNLMTSQLGTVLTPAWQESQATPNAVRVYLVKSADGATSTPALAPKDCRCILVDLPIFDAWVKGHSSGIGRLSLDPRYLLVFMLLHEVGHISQRSSGAEFVNGSLKQLNVDASLAKDAEEKADAFAAQVLRERARTTPASSTSLEANWVVTELTKLSFNMQAYRTLDEFASFATGKPSVYFDQNLSHPNLAWRVLRTNDLIQGSTATRELLEAFEDARRRGANPQPLYVRP